MFRAGRDHDFRAFKYFSFQTEWVSGPSVFGHHGAAVALGVWVLGGCLWPPALQRAALEDERRARLEVPRRDSRGRILRACR